MRILYYSDIDFVWSDGKAVNELSFCCSAEKIMGDDAFFAIPEQKESYPFLREKQFHPVNVVPYKNVLKYFNKAIVDSWRLRRFIKANEIDILVTRLPFLPVIPLLLSYLGVPIAIKTLGQYWKNYSRAPLISHRILSRLNVIVTERLITRAFAIDGALQGLNSLTAEKFKKGHAVFHVENAIDTERFSILPKREIEGYEFDLDAYPVLGFAGVSPSSRGARQMVEIAAALKERFPKIAVVVAGWDDGMQGVLSYAEKLGVGDRCYFFGQMPSDLMPKLFNLMDIGFSFYESEHTNRLGTAGQKVRQYISCGVHVVSGYGEGDFLVKRNFGVMQSQNDLDAMKENVLFLVEARQSNEIRTVMHNYAEKHFFRDSIMRKRLLKWQTLMDQS